MTLWLVNKYTWKKPIHLKAIKVCKLPYYHLLCKGSPKHKTLLHSPKYTRGHNFWEEKRWGYRVIKFLMTECQESQNDKKTNFNQILASFGAIIIKVNMWGGQNGAGLGSEFHLCCHFINLGPLSEENDCSNHIIIIDPCRCKILKYKMWLPYLQ